MVIGGRIPGVLVVVVLATSPAAVAEDLYILEKGASDISSILSLRNVNIYAILDNVLLAGATQSGAAPAAGHDLRSGADGHGRGLAGADAVRWLDGGHRRRLAFGPLRAHAGRY